MKVKYRPERTEMVIQPALFEAYDTTHDVGLTVYKGQAQLTAWSSERQQYDGAAFRGRNNVPIEALIALFDAYKEATSNG